MLENLYILWEKFSSTSNILVFEQVKAYLDLFLDLPYAGLKYQYVGNTLEKRLKYLDEHNEFQYNFNGFDCVTLIETVLALLNFNNKSNFSSNLSLKEFEENFAENLKKIRYKGAKPTFLSRNHFMSADWIPNNSDIIKLLDNKALIALKILENAQQNFQQSDKQNVAQNLKQNPKQKSYVDNPFITPIKNSQIKINKKSWLKKHVALEGIDPIDQSTIDKLENFDDVKITTQYLTLKWILGNYETLCSNLPECFIAFIVRPNWNLTEKIGTNLNISHLGFGIKRIENSAEIKFYHAQSEQKKQIVVIDFKDYLNYCATISTIDGVLFAAL